MHLDVEPIRARRRRRRRRTVRTVCSAGQSSRAIPVQTSKLPCVEKAARMSASRAKAAAASARPKSGTRFPGPLAWRASARYVQVRASRRTARRAEWRSQCQSSEQPPVGRGTNAPESVSHPRALDERESGAVREDGLGRAAPGRERAVQRRVLAVVAAGVEPAREAHGGPAEGRPRDRPVARAGCGTTGGVATRSRRSRTSLAAGPRQHRGQALRRRGSTARRARVRSARSSELPRSGRRGC